MDSLKTIINVSTDQRVWKYIKEINSISEESLNKTALNDGCRTYTYAEMFKLWDKYAAVFSALGMTGEKNARVGIMGSISSEVTFALYGLNMVGAEVSVSAPFSVLNINKVLQTVKNEKLTDLILTDDLAQMEIFGALFTMKEMLGLNNIICLHVPVGGACIDPGFSYAQEYKYMYTKGYFGPACMDTLIAKYENGKISYAEDSGSDTSFILHTSGTSTGTGKPIPLSDKSLNFFGKCYHQIPGVEALRDSAVCGVTIDLSNAYGLINQVHAPFAMNGTVVAVSGGALNPVYFKAIPAYGVSLLFTIPAMFEMWMKMPPITPFDFSSLKGIIIGGSAASASDKKRYYKFLRKHGAKEVVFINGYGLSEMGGACILSSPDINDESIGYPLPGVEVCLFDEDSGKYLTVEDAPCEGILYLHSDAMTCGTLDGAELIPHETILDKPYICSNDLVRMDTDGRITYLGRANRFFINNSGIKYETGKVETAFSGQEGIESCGIVAVYSKTTHDNIPMLCIKPLVNDKTALDVILGAFRNIFIDTKALSMDNVPLRVLVAEELPRNINGKIDVSKISKGEVEGRKYTVEKIKCSGSVTDFKLKPLKENADNMIQQVLSGFAKDTFANNMFNNNMFNGSFGQKGGQTTMNFNNSQAFFNNFSQMGSFWMNMMNRFSQMNPSGQMNQMTQMMADYANRMFMLNMQMTENIYKQNMKMLEMMNEMLQSKMASDESKEKKGDE